jgi:hypothetical protein
MNIAISYTQIRLNQGQLIAIMAILLLLLTHVAVAFEHDKTPENVHKKALIIKHNAILFNKVTGNSGEPAPFMQIYFMMKPAMENRVPVSKSRDKVGPDGWLEKSSFLEWNTLQMLKPEAQGGRKLAMIFETQQCAEKFGQTGTKPADCKVLGEEPARSTHAKTSKQQLLIPVFKKGRNSYQGGFIPVDQKGNPIIAQSPRLSNQPQSPQPQGGQAVMGYDIVFVIDSTKSMGKYFIPTTEVLQSFIKHLQKHARVGNDKIPLRMGLLFYRDRLVEPENCNIGFLSKWGKHLTSDIDGVIRVLKEAEETDCDSEEEAEAVLDALDRIFGDVQWRDNSFKIIILVGDAPPHPSDSQKNPAKLTVPIIIKEADERLIRFLTFKLGNDDKVFKDLALQRIRKHKGRYQSIPIHNDLAVFKTHLLTAMTEEWNLVRAANEAMKQGGASVLDKASLRQKFNIGPYEALIIKARLPPSGNSQGFPEFVKGWIPQKIQKQLAVGEFIFMAKARLKFLTSVLGIITVAAEMGRVDGYDAFLNAVRNVSATQMKESPYQLFLSGESLNSILQKANILPFKSDMLTFSDAEVKTWPPTKYKEIYTILEEKVKTLREFMDNPSHSHVIGGKRHVYVPRALFP